MTQSSATDLDLFRSYCERFIVGFSVTLLFRLFGVLYNWVMRLSFVVFSPAKNLLIFFAFYSCALAFEKPCVVSFPFQTVNLIMFQMTKFRCFLCLDFFFFCPSFYYRTHTPSHTPDDGASSPNEKEMRKKTLLFNTIKMCIVCWKIR